MKRIAYLLMLAFAPLTLERTVAEMYRLINAYTSDVVDVAWTSPEQIFHAVQGIPYVRDQDAPECRGAIECLKRPVYTLMAGGDCDDKAVLAGAALTLIGVPFRIVTTSYVESERMQHTYLEVYVRGSWLPFDATHQGTQLYREEPYTKKWIWT